jgi:hypothetical protein
LVSLLGYFLPSYLLNRVDYVLLLLVQLLLIFNPLQQSALFNFQNQQLLLLFHQKKLTFLIHLLNSSRVSLVSFDEPDTLAELVLVQKNLIFLSHGFSS